MKVIEIDAPEDLHIVLKKFRKSSRYKFRGQSVSDWKLIPKAGRPQFSKVQDVEMFRHWKRRGVNYLKTQGLTDLEYLVAAQHTGLATRLLDWSHNPLIAAFFAATDNINEHGAIWVAKPNSNLSDHNIQPFGLSKQRVVFYQPSAPVSRAINQYSYFSIHTPPTLELSRETCDLEGDLEKIIIRKEIKQELLFLLNHYGVNYLTIYPDLEGLSKHISWFSENYNYWTNTIED
jgi:hypothetical protein